MGNVFFFFYLRRLRLRDWRLELHRMVVAVAAAVVDDADDDASARLRRTSNRRVARCSQTGYDDRGVVLPGVAEMFVVPRPYDPDPTTPSWSATRMLMDCRKFHQLITKLFFLINILN